MTFSSPLDGISGMAAYPELPFHEDGILAKTRGKRVKSYPGSQNQAPVPATTPAYNGSTAARIPRHELFQSQFKKTLLCRFFESGQCRHSEDCSFAHGQTDLSIRPDLTKTSLCRAWLSGNCVVPTDQCQFAHGEHDLRVSHAFSKTRWDSRWLYKDARLSRRRPSTNTPVFSRGSSGRSTMETLSDDASQKTSSEVPSGDSLQDDQEEFFLDSDPRPKQEAPHRQQFLRRVSDNSKANVRGQPVRDAVLKVAGPSPPPNDQCFVRETSSPVSFLMPYNPMAGFMIPILSPPQDPEPAGFNPLCVMPMSPSQVLFVQEQYNENAAPLSPPMSPAMTCSREQMEAHLIAALPDCYED